VDVVICHLRKRLKPYELHIETSWACGYFMEPVEQKKALTLLEIYSMTGMTMLPENGNKLAGGYESTVHEERLR
jgi:hypothetical protein